MSGGLSPAIVDVWCVPCATGAAAREQALRDLLRPLLGHEPAFVREDGGRRRLADGGPLDLRFSVAQRGSLALVAVRPGHDVGVDVEAPKRGLETTAMAYDHFDPAGLEAFLADPDADRDAAFLRAWTRHEALAKACGAGLVAAWPADARERYDVRSVDVPGCFAAVASEGGGWTIRLTDARL